MSKQAGQVTGEGARDDCEQHGEDGHDPRNTEYILAQHTKIYIKKYTIREASWCFWVTDVKCM